MIFILFHKRIFKYEENYILKYKIKIYKNSFYKGFLRNSCDNLKIVIRKYSFVSNFKIKIILIKYLLGIKMYKSICK